MQYKKGDNMFKSEKTINNFIEINDKHIKHGESWTYQLVAVNSKGESTPSEVINLTKDEDELPPIVWGAKRLDTNLFIAFSVSHYDYLYEVAYGFSPHALDQLLTTKVQGVLNIPNLEKGTPIYYKMRVIKQWGFASEWTQEFKSE